MKKEKKLPTFFKILDFFGPFLNLYAVLGFLAQGYAIAMASIDMGFSYDLLFWGDDLLFLNYNILFSAYILGQIMIAAVFARKKVGKKSLITCIKYSFCTSILDLWYIFNIILSLPYVFFSVLTIQGSMLICFGTGMLLCVGGYQYFIGDIEGTRQFFASWREASIGFIVFISSGTLSFYMFSLGNGDGKYIINKGRYLVDRLRRYLISVAEGCMKQP
ncbi:MAG: hypothetical protein CSB33_03465 [Desulfobacterales bacterium]|nr:MAG: hypothetical protein CSB33_03465 [Desulfobacterales bacterium]